MFVVAICVLLQATEKKPPETKKIKNKKINQTEKSKNLLRAKMKLD